MSSGDHAKREGRVEVSTRAIGPNRYTIIATTTLDRPVGEVWALLCDFERLVAVGLPGMTSDFEWLNGGSPDQVPSRFQFAIGTARVVEEIYHLDGDQYILRYRMLEPAMGILKYDAEFELTPVSNEQTFYSVTREVTLESGVVDGLAGLVATETQNVKDHFARQR